MTKPRLVVKLEFDHDITCPNDDGDGQWKLYSFNRNHNSFANPSDVGLEYNRDGDGRIPTIGLRRKLEVGLAFLLDYYEHGGSSWSFSGSGVQCRFDTASNAGILIWEHKPKDMGAKTYDARQKDAGHFLESFNCWANGEGFGFSVDDTEGNNIDSCWGFIGTDDGKKHMITDYVLPAIEGHSYIVTGEAKDCFDLEDHEEPESLAEVVKPWVDEVLMDREWAL